MKINTQLVNWLNREIASDTTSIAVYDNHDSLYGLMVLNCLHAGLLEFQEHMGDTIYYQLTPQGEILIGRTEYPATEAPPAIAATGERVADKPGAFVALKLGYEIWVHDNRYQVYRDAVLKTTKSKFDAALEWISEQATTQPEPAVTGVGERRSHYHLDSGNFHTHIRRGELPDSKNAIVATFDDDSMDTWAETCLNAIESETATLRSQFASKQAVVTELAGRIDDMEFAIMRADGALAHPDHALQYKLDEARKLLHPFVNAGYGERERVATLDVDCMKAVFQTLLTTVGKLPLDEKNIRKCLDLLAARIPD